jgi:diacylglycerol kinase family enzyme
VNVGIGASVARYANSGVRKFAGDHLGTFWALFKAFASYRTSNLVISMDGKKEEIANVYNISIGKTRYIASGIKVHNTLSEGDGRFYILTVKNVRWANVPHCLKVIYSGEEIVRSDTASLTYAKDIDLYAGHEVSEVEFDGDPQGFLPCQISMAQDELEIINEAD